MTRALVGWAFGIPNNNPAFASFLTGMFSVFGVVGAISLFTQPGGVSAGVVVLLVSLGLLAYTIYVATDTQFFQSNWIDQNTGNLKHGFIRYIGPILLGLSIIATIVLIVIMIEAAKSTFTNN